MAKKDSSVFESRNGDFYAIKRVLEVADHASPADGQVILLCLKIVPENAGTDFPPHISEFFFSVAYSLLPLSIPDIAKPCVLISFDEEEHYLCSVPNLIERD